MSGCWLACGPGALEESITGRVAYILRERDAKRADAPPDIHFAGPTIRTGQMRRTIFLLRCLGAACFQATACSPVALGQTPEGLPQLGQQELIQGIIQAIKEFELWASDRGYGCTEGAGEFVRILDRVHTGYDT